MLAGIFVHGGLDAFLHPESKAVKADYVTAPVAEALDVPDDPARLVRINGAVQMVAGSALALGKLPRLAALVLAGSLVPTTLAGHHFWDEPDAKSRAAQKIQFLKNSSMLG